MCGGADSVDRIFRTEGYSWWPDEQVTESDIKDIPIDDYDYVFTHCCPYKILNFYQAILTDSRFDQTEIDHTSENNLQVLADKVNFKNWWFGHYHQDCQLDDTFAVLYNGFRELD